MHNSPSTIANAVCMLISLLFLISIVIFSSNLLLNRMYIESLTTFLIAMTVYISYIGFRNSVLESADDE